VRSSEIRRGFYEYDPEKNKEVIGDK